MGRTAKMQAAIYRLPTYHAASNRWRFRIHHHQGQKDWYWPADGDSSTPPPDVIAAAVAVQDRWRELKREWPRGMRAMLELTHPDKDWSSLVWIEVPTVQADIDFYVQQLRMDAEEEYRAAVRKVISGGMSKFLGSARRADAMKLPDELMRILRPEGTADTWFDEALKAREQTRLHMVEGLATTRAVIHPVTVREAMAAYLAKHRKRTTLKTGDWIKESTFQMLRKTLLSVFGLSCSEMMQPVGGDVPFDLDVPLNTVSDSVLENLARFWHGMPEGVASTRTIRNRLQAAREFFNWCGRRNYGFKFCKDVAKIFTAEDVETKPKSFDAEQIKRILAQGKSRGRLRLKLYVLLGLICGYTQVDCCEIAVCDYLTEDGERYIHRYRSKEARPKRGSRPIRVKHWIPPELAELIDAELASNPKGFLFNSETGRVLNPPHRRRCRRSDC